MCGFFSTLFIKKVLGGKSVGVQYDHFIKAFSLGIQVFYIPILLKE